VKFTDVSNVLAAPLNNSRLEALMPAAYTHPAGHEIDFPAPGLFSIKMSDGRQGDVPLHVKVPPGEHRLYGALIMSTLGIPVPPADLRTPDGGMMVWSESTDGGISFSELPRNWADARVMQFCGTVLSLPPLVDS
jgi:hypothetical protein